MIEPLATLEDDRLDAYLRLTEAQLRNKLEPEKGIFIAESDKVITRALDAGYEPLSLLIPDFKLKSMMPLVQRVGEGVPVFTAPLEQIETITGYELTRGILCAMRRKPLPSVEDVVAGAKRIAVLEDITNHTNVGAVFRSAAALNIDAVLVTPGCCDPLYRRAVRVSMGTVFQVPWTRIGQTVQDWPGAGMEELRRLGFKTASLALREDSLRIDDPRLAQCEKLALLLGTEGDGLSDSTLAESDYTVIIPMAHNVDSLNVAAASAVAFYAVCEH